VKEQNLFLPEWLEFHLLQGVQRFSLYDNGSANTTLFLDDYITLGHVELTSWPADEEHCTKDEDTRAQWRSCAADDGNCRLSMCQARSVEDCISRYRFTAAWLGHFDVDEFIFASDTSSSLWQILNALPSSVKVARFTGTTFGTSNVVRHHPAARLRVPVITEALVHRHVHDANGSAGCHKEIGRANLLESTSVHSFIFRHRRDRFAAVNFGPPGSAIQFNHYSLRSDEDAALKWHLNHYKPMNLTARSDFNAVRDDAAASFAGRLRARLLTRASLLAEACPCANGTPA